MNRIIFLIMTVWLSCHTMSAQVKVNTAEHKSMVSAIEKAASAMKSMQCKFRQTKTLRLLNDKIVSSGVMYYSQPTKLRWQYLQPYAYTFVINGSKVMMKSDNKKNIIDARQSKMFKEITQIMVNSVTGKCLSNSKDFKVDMYKSDKEWIAHLSPLNKQMKSMFKTIILHIDARQRIVTKVEMVERGGDTTNIELYDYKTNVQIDAKRFALN